MDLEISIDLAQILNLADKTVVMWDMDQLKEKKKKRKERKSCSAGVKFKC